FYNKSFPPGSIAMLASLRPGVRVLKLRSDYESVALAQLQRPGDPTKMLALKQGDSFSTPSGGVRIVVTSISGGNAVLTIDRNSLPANVGRLAGGSRYTTAVEISSHAYPGGAPVVYVAFGGDYPDALSAAPAAVKEGGPLLLTE